jgi:hypothetical protein
MYIGNTPLYQSFVTDTFSGNGSTTAFTMSVAPANTPSVLVAVSGVLQDPSTYSVLGTTLTFSGAPPSGTSNISVRYLGIPASNITTTSYRTVTEFTATASQTTFTPASYTPGFINVYRNGSLLGSADYTATNGTTVVLAVGATVGDLVSVESFYVSSVLNAIPAVAGAVSTSYIAAGAVTPTQLSTQAQYTGFKNRIINGEMDISQGAAGATITPAVTSAYVTNYPVDRFQVLVGAASKLTTAQASVAPAGFSFSTLITSSSAYTVGAGEVFVIRQNIEGFNTADLGWGTADAQTVTLSFWVRSSLTGTFGGSLQNSASNRSYPFTYTINAANTWEYETITIAGDTTGTWIGATNGIGIRVNLGLGVGATFSGTAGAWAGSDFDSATGATSVVGTSGATFYVTGVQLEKGSVATSFDFRSYGTELALCQRYYEVFGSGGVGGARTNTTWSMVHSFKVNKRASPTLTHIANYTLLIPGINTFTASALTSSSVTTFGASINVTVNTGDTAGRAVLTGDPGTSLVDGLSASAEL